MMNGGGVDVALAEQGFDTFKLLESLDIPYDELLKPRGEWFVRYKLLLGITLKINMEPKHQGFGRWFSLSIGVIFVYFCWLEYVFPFGARPLFRGDL